MSMCTWHTYGYGIKIDNIKFDEVGIKNLVATAPNVMNHIVEESGISFENLTLEDILSFVPDYNCFIDEDEDLIILTSLLIDVISENEDIKLVLAKNYDNECFVVYPPTYLWRMTEGEKKLKSHDDVKNLFRKYCDILTNGKQTLEELDYEWQEIENGG